MLLYREIGKFYRLNEEQVVVTSRVGFAVDSVIRCFHLKYERDASIHVPSEITPGVPTFSLHQYNGAGQCKHVMGENSWSSGLL